MIAFEDIKRALEQLAIPESAPVIAHASLSAFGPVDGGGPALLNALLQVYQSLVMPAFTYKTMVTPLLGPPDNALDYGVDQNANLMAQIFHPEMPVDRLMGVVPELLRRTPGAARSSHPILSFAGLHAAPVLAAQTLQSPLGPIEALWQRSGWVLLLGVGHDVNTSLHLAELLAGRKGFIRWGLTPQGVVECGGFPGCSDGFDAIAPWAAGITRTVPLGRSRIAALPLQELIPLARARIEADPLALLCDRSYCPRCAVVRRRLDHRHNPDLQHNGSTWR